MVRYIKCPRCELNYIDAEKQEYCDVCIAEMKGNKLQFADLDDEIEEELEEESTDICPICGVNHIQFGETMCEACRAKSEYDEEEEIDPEKDDGWKNYLDDDTEDLTIDDNSLDDEELKEELEGDDEEMENSDDEDDFFDEDVDSLDDLDDEDDDDFDDEDDDDDLF